MLAADYSKIADRLYRRQPEQSLRPSTVWEAGLASEIGHVEDAALKSALLLWNDQLDESHEISQGIHSRIGSYLHGIMHRMEGDYSNAKYWFHRVSEYPVWGEIERGAAQLGYEGWTPYRFVDDVEKACRNGGGASVERIRLLERIQRLEMALVVNDIGKQHVGGVLIELE